eukprot:COSAG01_NODE_2445_length_7675_cov_30.173036_2_plen_77_part_00
MLLRAGTMVARWMWQVPVVAQWRQPVVATQVAVSAGGCGYVVSASRWLSDSWILSRFKADSIIDLPSADTRMVAEL